MAGVSHTTTLWAGWIEENKKEQDPLPLGVHGLQIRNKVQIYSIA